MSKRRMVYVLTSGSYSDYSIHAVFTDKALAEAFRAKYGADYYVIEEYEANPEGFRTPDGKEPWYVEMQRDGTVYHAVPKAEDFAARGDSLFGPHLLHRPTAAFWIYARDREHAVKIANERRTQMIANNEWPEPDPLPDPITGKPIIRKPSTPTWKCESCKADNTWWRSACYHCRALRVTAPST